MITSFIISKDDWDALLSGELPHTSNKLLSDSYRLIAEEYANGALSHPSPEVTVCEGLRFCVIVEPYLFSPGALRVTPYQNIDELQAALEERSSYE